MSCASRVKYVALLSGECVGLGFCELEAYLEARGAGFKAIEKEGNVVVFEAEDGVDFSCLALAHEVCLFFGDDISDVDTGKLDGKVMVRGVKISKSVSASSFEKKAGMWLNGKGIGVDFSSRCVLRIYVAEKKCYYGLLVCAVDRKKLRSRDAKKRPYLGSGTLNAIYARALVNLLRCSFGDAVCDAFCGSGAFLVEAGLMEMKVFGCDISMRHVEGAKKNLSFYGAGDYNLWVMDALDVPKLKRKFDGVVCDLPWGKSTVMKYGKQELVRRFMEILPEILKRGKYAVISCDMRVLWHPVELRLVGEFELYVHRSSKRFVRVFRYV